jgi:nucleoside-diphosphate-sugar epimerase
MRVLITGASGFIGGALTRRFAGRADVELTALGRAELDLADREAIAARLVRSRPEVVIHAAGRTLGHRDALFADNALATANLAEAIGAAAPEAGLILLGSAAQYGVSADQVPWRESDPCAPFEPYGLSKLAAETSAMAAARRDGFGATALRLFNVITPEPQGEQVFAAFLRRAASAAAAGPPPWRVRMGPLAALRDFIDIEDVLTAVERVIERGAWGEVINVCGGEGRTARALLAAVGAQTGGAILVEEDPPSAPPMLPWSVGDPTRCEALLGLRPAADFAAVARRAAAWLTATAEDAADARSHA